eukprot:481818-Rhodomonas_salina.2
MRLLRLRGLCRLGRQCLRRQCKDSVCGAGVRGGKLKGVGCWACSAQAVGGCKCSPLRAAWTKQPRSSYVPRKPRHRAAESRQVQGTVALLQICNVCDALRRVEHVWFKECDTACGRKAVGTVELCCVTK